MTTLEIEQAEYSLNFRAMNTEIEMIIYGKDDTEETRHKLEQAGGQVSLLFSQTEERLSRFRPESELSRLNQTGHLTEASPLLFESIQAALEMAALTGGIFDPTILENLEQAGYDRSFELLVAQTYSRVATFPLWPMDKRYLDIKLEVSNQSITLPAGVRVDLGGIGKGMTVDRASRLLEEMGFEDFVVSAGGDMFVSGHPPLAPEGWTVAVTNPLNSESTLTEIMAQNQAVATSSVIKRRWQQGGQIRHHLIDPRTGKPVVNNLAAVTVCAPTTRLADVLAKTALILGPTEGKAFIQKQPECSAIFVTMNQEII
jgi:thiamine biosynthesis lipoprotein